MKCSNVLSLLVLVEEHEIDDDKHGHEEDDHHAPQGDFFGLEELSAIRFCAEELMLKLLLSCARFNVAVWLQARARYHLERSLLTRSTVRILPGVFKNVCKKRSWSDQPFVWEFTTFQLLGYKDAFGAPFSKQKMHFAM